MKSLLITAILGASILGNGAALAGELFATYDLLPSEEVALIEAARGRVESLQSALGSINQMEIILMIQPSEVSTGGQQTLPACTIATATDASASHQ